MAKPLVPIINWISLLYLYNLDVGPWIRLTVGFSPWVSSGDDGTRWMLSRHPLPRPMWDHKIPGGEKEGEGRLIECGEPKGWKCRVIGLDHSKYTPACAGWSGRTTPLHILQHRQGDRVGPHHFPCWDPKTYQLDQTYGIQGKVGDKEGGSCHKGRRIIFPKGPTINPKSWHFEIQSRHSLGESNPRPYDLQASVLDTTLRNDSLLHI